MNIFLYIMLFIMGTFFGSFFTLAVFRIPLKKDITHERSFCPNCNHKLGVLDLIPVLSYLILGGKCRYCGEKVRIRYLILEVLSGFIFVIAYVSLHIQNVFLDTAKIIDFVSFLFLYVTVVLVAGIDKEYQKINSSILLFGVIGQAMYILYLSIIETASMYRYIIYFVIFILLFIRNKILSKNKQSYLLEILLFLSYIGFVLDIQSMLPILVLSMVLMLILGSISKEKYNKKEKMPWGFSIGFSTIVYAIVENFLEFWII